MSRVGVGVCVVMLVSSLIGGVAIKVDAFEQSPQSTIAMTAPPELRSVSNSPASESMLRQVTAGNKAMTMLDAYLTPEDIDRINRGQEPAKDRYVVVFLPRDDRFRYPTQRMFTSITSDIRKSLLDQKGIDHANAYMKAKGQDGELLEVSGDRILVDSPNCFAKLVVGKYDFTDQHAPPPMDMVLAYVRIHGKMVVIDAYAKGRGQNEAWLVKDVSSWLNGLGQP